MEGPRGKKVAGAGGGAALPGSQYAAFEGQGGGGHKGKVAMVGAIAKAQGVDPSDLVAIGMVESGLKSKARPGKGTAKGLFQFIDSTWAWELKQHGERLGIPPGTSVYDDTANTLLAIEFMKGNREHLKGKPGVPENPTAIDDYMGHFLGVGDAEKFYKARADSPNALGKDVLKRAAGNNPPVFFHGKGGTGRAKTLEEIYASFKKKLRAHGARV